ncbi:3-hydroxyacyl-CoA dehydrogenase NAD-binding domain-containing protein [Nocardioides pantholopis]|uniref:3-hydroxyacyl-CoA dehydrogenase NAD-binding domain-containing protein n=1 Tax=Nocardioides pantholopis TaxID=2483798 RepID=UPI000F09885F|nr:3-hydroxyacyl-CoA dehydrogenase NAD-binding domain-containing protein [Nocardioides pantholopis]
MPTLQHFTLTEQDGVRVAILDVPGRTMNVIDASVLDELRRVVDDALADPSVRGLVLASGKPGAFGGGADLTSLPALAGDPGTPQFLQRTHDLMATMADSPKPFVAAVHGYALGGALEVALGCGSIVVAEDAVLGLPESTLGLVPGGAGTQLVLSRVDPVAAIELLVSGRTLPAREALQAGLVDRVVDRDDLLATAIALAASGTAPARVHPTGDAALLAEVTRAAAGVRRPPSGAAREALVAAVTAGLARGREAGLAAEREQFLALLGSDECAALVHMFHVETAAKRRFRGTSGRPDAIAVVGAGQMGAGIAATAASHGISAAVRDIDEARIEEARNRVRAVGGADAERRWTGTADWDRFADADVVVEAVFEEPGLKRETLALVDRQVGEGALITTNTSAIPVASLADAVSGADRFLGTHFFSPVEKMPLVELVPHDGTSDVALARAGGLARALGKVPVVVADFPGFFTSRVYARWLVEGLRLLADGADPAAIEQEAKAVGFPVGPLQASDEVTLELVLKASVVQVAERVLTGRVDVPAVKGLLERLIAAGIRGKRFGRGFYAYDAGRRAGFDPGLAGLTGPGAGVAPGEAGERLLLAFVTESLLCWDDATLCHPDDGDLAAVLGIGFPRRLGGPFHWIDRTGAAEVLRRLDGLDRAAFPAGDALPRLAGEGRRFADEPRHARPGSVPTPATRTQE